MRGTSFILEKLVKLHNGFGDLNARESLKLLGVVRKVD